MKKILIIGLLSCGLFTQAQLTMSKQDGTPIASGQVFGFNAATYPEGELDFYVHNLSSSPANVRINCTSLINTDGVGFELCFANECLSNVEEGTNYPLNMPYLTIPAGGHSGNDGHLLNTVVGVGPYPKDYSFRAFQVGNPTNFVDITYRFDPALSTEEIAQLQTSGVIVKSTVLQNELTLDALKPTSFELFDLNGKVVLKADLKHEVKTFNVAQLPAGMYVLHFTDSYGNRTTQKVMKK